MSSWRNLQTKSFTAKQKTLLFIKQAAKAYCSRQFSATSLHNSYPRFCPLGYSTIRTRPKSSIIDHPIHIHIHYHTKPKPPHHSQPWSKSNYGSYPQNSANPRRMPLRKRLRQTKQKTMNKRQEHPSPTRPRRQIRSLEGRKSHQPRTRIQRRSNSIPSQILSSEVGGLGRKEE